ncbi:MAG: hypothetical protein ACXADC_03820 [Candidatus Thorarchaeota archaeon]|jgi:hypothetical protein
MHRGRKTGLLAGVMMLTLLVSVVTVFPTAITQTRNADLEVFSPAAFVSKNILFDESHTANASAGWIPSNASLFSAMLDENGYTSDTNFNVSLDSGILSGYDILVIFFPMLSLTAGEITAVQTFVSNGGSLLLVGVDGTNFWNFNPSKLNPISSAFGIEFNNDMLDVTVTSFPVHNVTYGVTSFWTRDGQIRGCSLNVTGSAATTVVEYGGSNLTVVTDYGLGRVAAVGSPGPFTKYAWMDGGNGPSHYQFSLNVIDWLARNPRRDVVIPDIAKITVGPGPSLSPAELDEYTLFIGLFHDHTTHSDGQHEPFEMLDVGLEQGLDFMVMTDHSHVTPIFPEGISGALAMESIALENNLDITIVVGAELSSVHHTSGFPLTDNIWTSDQQTAVDEIHAQGAIAVFNHPNIGPTYADTYERYDEYGFDAIDMDNSNFFYGLGEDGFFRQFMGANDHHSMHDIGWVLNAVFVQNPTGSDGRISDADLVDAVMNRRNVVLDTINNFVYGEETWVNRVLEIWDDAETTLTSATATVQALKDAGNDVGLSEIYLENAQTAMDHWNPARALRLANNATSSLALGLDLTVNAPAVLAPGTDLDITIQLTNNHTFAVEVNASMYISQAASVTPSYTIISTPAEDTISSSLTATADNFGLALLYVNLHSFNTPEYLMPVIARNTGMVNNVSHTVREVDAEYEVDVSFFIGRDYMVQLSSVVLYYDDGSGETSTAMFTGWNTKDQTLGPFDPGSTITYHVVVTTTRGIVIDLGVNTIELPGGTTTTTTTTTTATTTPPTPPPPIDTTLLLMIAGGIAVVVVVLVIFTRRR